MAKLMLDGGGSAPKTQSAVQAALAADKKKASTPVAPAKVSSPSASSATVKAAPAPLAINPVSKAPNILTAPNVKPATQSTTTTKSSGVNTTTLAGIMAASGTQATKTTATTTRDTEIWDIVPKPATTSSTAPAKAPATTTTPKPAPTTSTTPTPVVPTPTPAPSVAPSPEYFPPPVNPTPYIAEPPSPPPAPPPIKTADPDLVIFNDDSVDERLIIDLLLENIGGQELLTTARFDTVNGQDVKYQPIKNLGLIQQEYNPNTLLKPQQTSENIFENFPLRLNSKIPNVGNGPNGSNLYREQSTGDIIIEFVNLTNNEQVEVEIATSGIIYEVGI